MAILSELTSCRYILAYMGFYCTMVVYFCRINISIAIVAMTKQLQNNDTYSNSTTDICPSNSDDTTDDDDPHETGGEEEGVFDWDKAQQGDLLGCYYYGYICTQILGAWLSSKYGFKIILLATTFVTSIITIVTPFLAQAGYGWIFASRIVMGFCHGVTFPLLQGCWSVWAPPMETSNLIAIYTAGNSVGTCLIFPLGGLLAGSSLGWQSIFYFTGGSGILWCICWAFLVYDSPSQHPRISQEEKMYIESSIEVQQQHAKSSLGNEELDNKAVPWKAMLTSKVVWSVAIAHLASNWGVYQMNSLLPTYLNDVLHFDIESNGLISATPFIFQSLMTFIGGWYTDKVRGKGWVRTLTIRKINTILGLLLPAVTVVLAGYSGCNAPLAISLFTLSVGFSALTIPGNKASMMEFAPKYAGIIYAISNTLSNISGFLAPITTGRLLKSNNSLEQWQLAFWISALINVPGVIAFQIFGSDQIQTWAK